MSDVVSLSDCPGSDAPLSDSTILDYPEFGPPSYDPKEFGWHKHLKFLYKKGFRDIPGIPGYQVNEYSVVISLKNPNKPYIMTPSGPDNDRVSLFIDGKEKHEFIYRLSARAFIPKRLWEATVDHIDNIHENHFIENLQFLSLIDHGKKSSAERKNRGGPARSKPIWLLTGHEGAEKQEFPSVSAAADELDLYKTQISTSARSGGHLSGGKVNGENVYFKFKTFEDEVGEEWKTHKVLEDYLESLGVDKDYVTVSTKGRVCYKRTGIKTRGAKLEKYSRVKIGGKQVLVHWLVFMAAGKNPIGQVDADGKKLVVCHKDKIPLLQDGRYRNFPEDLRLDTQSANLLESHESGTLAATKKRKAEAEAEVEAEASVPVGAEDESNA